MSDLTIGNWIAIVGVGVAVIFGIIQCIRGSASKSGKFDVNQSSGAFSKGNQKINIKVNQNDK